MYTHHAATNCSFVECTCINLGGDAAKAADDAADDADDDADDDDAADDNGDDRQLEAVRQWICAL